MVDYLLWALQRYILQGEKRYFAAMEHHYEQILDIYENDVLEGCIPGKINLNWKRLLLL